MRRGPPPDRGRGPDSQASADDEGENGLPVSNKGKTTEEKRDKTRAHDGRQRQAARQRRAAKRAEAGGRPGSHGGRAGMDARTAARGQAVFLGERFCDSKNATPFLFGGEVFVKNRAAPARVVFGFFKRARLR